MKKIGKKLWLILGMIVLVIVVLVAIVSRPKKEDETKTPKNVEQIQEDFFEDFDEETDIPDSDSKQDEKTEPDSKVSENEPGNVPEDEGIEQFEDTTEKDEFEEGLPGMDSSDNEEWSGFY